MYLYAFRFENSLLIELWWTTLYVFPAFKMHVFVIIYRDAFLLSRHDDNEQRKVRFKSDL